MVCQFGTPEGVTAGISFIETATDVEFLRETTNYSFEWLPEVLEEVFWRVDGIKRLEDEEC